jgi:hypothetical protein
MIDKKQAKQKSPGVIQLVLAIRDCRCFRGPERQLLHALALHARAGKKDGAYWFSAFPSYPTLVKETGLDRRTLMRAAKNLAETEVLRRKKRSHTSTIYYLAFGIMKSYAAQVLENERVATGEDSDPEDDGSE